MADRILQLPEVVVPGKRLGRHVAHDPRSLRYLARESAPQTTTWKRWTPVLDQGNLGSCVGNAFTGILGSDVYFDTVPTTVKLDEAFAVKVYSLATQLDGFPGQYPPDDSGTSGIAGAKAVQQDELASGYTHATSLGACYTLIKSGPFAIGVGWRAGMDDPTSEGVVHATGQVRGGHEVEVLNYNASTGLWECVNSWGDSWAKGGHFFVPDEDMTKLLADQGDATQITPITQPAPVPTPVPTPASTWPPEAAYDLWKAHPIRERKRLANAIDSWLAGGTP